MSNGGAASWGRRTLAAGARRVAEIPEKSSGDFAATNRQERVICTRTVVVREAVRSTGTISVA
jgi:hypothetical protein